MDDADRQCGSCETWLSGKVAEVNGRYYHPACFFNEFSVSESE